jgi:dihydroflavonol-4-reductase
MEKVAYVISGAEGHLGTTLIHLLENRGFLIRALVFQEPKERSLDPRVSYVRGDVTNKDSLRLLFYGLSDYRIVVIHCAAVIDIAAKPGDPRSFSVNVEGTKNLFSLFEEYRGFRFIHVGSVDAFKAHNVFCDENNPLVDDYDHASPYPASKAKAIAFIKEKQKEGKDAIIVYPSAILGPFDDGHNALIQLMMDYLKGKMPGVVPGGYDVVDVRDVAGAIIALSEGPSKGDSFILSGFPISLEAILLNARKWNGGKGKRFLVYPFFIARIGLPFVTLHCRIHHSRALYTSFALSIIKHRNVFSNRRAKEAFGYAPRQPEVAIKDSLDYLKEHSYL